MSFYDYSVSKRKGGELPLSEFRGRVVLVVNTATGCGFTPQYEGLEMLYEKYHERGFEVLDLPCNQFGSQAPGSDEEIHRFCTARYKTKFDQMKKLEVNGENEHPLYTFLKREAPAEEVRGLKNKAAMAAIRKISKTAKKPEDIQWNFTKFLVDREGRVVKRFDPTFDPKNMEEVILKLL